MKVAFFTDSYLPTVNGVSYAVENLAQRLAKKHQVEIYAPSGKNVGWVEKRGRVVVRRYASVPLPTYPGIHIAFPGFLNVYNCLDHFDPDIIHVHTVGTIGLLGVLLAKVMKKPLVGTYHTLYSEALMYVSPAKIFGKYLKAIERVTEGMGLDIKVLRNGDKPIAGKDADKETLPQKMTWSLVNRVYRYADVIICPSEAIKRELVKRRLRKGVVALSNGLDVTRFWAKKDYRLRNRIVHVGRLSFEKNVDVVIRAFAKIAHELPRVQLVIAGDGPARKDLEELCVKLGVHKKVRFLGMVKRDNLGWVYRDSDVFVTASAMETLGLVVLEAMACGLPVVGVAAYALPDLIRSGDNGFVVGVGNEEEMAESIIRIIKNDDVRKKMGMEARKTAEGHDIDKIVAETEKMYKRLSGRV
jgi:1,2-diacylglycerol 3-alpha-glucosyltransferase